MEAHYLHTFFLFYEKITSKLNTFYLLISIEVQNKLIDSQFYTEIEKKV